MMALNSEESLLKSLRNSFENHGESQLETQFFGCAPLVASHSNLSLSNSYHCGIK